MNIYVVVKGKKCISCGACEVSCPVGAITIRYNNKTGFYAPIVSNKCVDCKRCLKTCPAYYSSLSNSSNTLLGNSKEIILAHTTYREMQHNATSGGVVSAICLYLLENNIVDAVLSVCYNKNSPIEAESIILNKKIYRIWCYIQEILHLGM